MASLRCLDYFLGDKKTNVDTASQDVAAAPVPVEPQKEDPDNELKGKKPKEDGLQKENKSQEVEMDGKLLAATRTSSSCDSDNELGASAEKIFPHVQDGLKEDPTPQQCHAWTKEGACSSCGGKDHKRR
eukprot:10819380-Ditylum_brightwellii.AAC.1